MKELSFNYGRLSFSMDTLEMAPSLPEKVEGRIQYFYLDDFGLMKAAFRGFEDLKEELEKRSFIWLHLHGILDDDFWAELTAFLDISDEQIKHIRSPHQRSFFEEYPDALFWTLQRPSVSEKVDAIEIINFFMKDRVLITRQFSEDDAFTMVMHRLMAQGELLKNFGVDKLAAELIEDVISSYVKVLAIGGTRLEEIQNKIIRHPGKEELKLINVAQQVIWIFLKSVWPIETVLQGLHRSKNPFITAEGKQELGYRQDEASSVVRLFETYREMSYNLMDVYVSGLGLRTNETTTVLTVIATLFLPPTLIAGIYGMNFQNIPELNFPYSYHLCLASMFFVSGGIFWWLKQRGYIEL